MASGPNPYVGPRPFEENEQERFFGRSQEANDVASLVLAHSAVLLYGQSGAGKTSLVNAGVTPLLRKQGFGIASARMSGQLCKNPTRLGNAPIGNVYLTGPTLTLAGEFADFAKQPSDTSRVVIFDQFEELFLLFPERWQEREEFFQRIGAALKDAPSICALLVMQEEYIARLEHYLHFLPERLRTRYHMEPLREPAAISAVRDPVINIARREFDVEAAKAVVEKLLQIQVSDPAGKISPGKREFVDAVQLQLVCQRFWEKLPEGVDAITKKVVGTCVDINETLVDFYDRLVNTIARTYSIEEGDLRSRLEESLITTVGRRETSSAERANIPKEAFRELAASHFLRPVVVIRTDPGEGRDLFELAHENFIVPIRESNAKWRAQQWGREAINSEQQILGWLKRKAHEISQSRKIAMLEREKLSRLDDYYLDPGAQNQDWFDAFLHLAASVIDGGIRLPDVGNESYGRLEEVWLKDAKQLKAYFVWKTRDMDADWCYYEACREIRNRLLYRNFQASRADFERPRGYIESRYLSADGKSLDEGKKACRDLLQAKAYRIWEVTGKVHGAEYNWECARRYVIAFYENIVPAVTDDDPERVRSVIEAFRYSKDPVNRFLVINCFEAALAVYFLNPDTVRRHCGNIDNIL